MSKDELISAMNISKPIKSNKKETKGTFLNKKKSLQIIKKETF